jgi:hypothetical protein
VNLIYNRGTTHVSILLPSNVLSIASVPIRLLTVLLRPAHRVPAALLDVDPDPDDDARRRAQREQEREAHPVVPRLVDDRLDDVRADHARRAVREPEEAEEHVVEPWRRELGHHRLREGVVRRLEDAEHDVVRPALLVRYTNEEQCATRHVPELPDVMEAELGRPNADHAPERDKDRYDVRNHEHAFRGDLPVLLDVPEPERRRGRRDRL